MTQDPKTIEGTLLAPSALELMNSLKISSLFIVQDGKPVGIIRTLDLLKIGAA